MVHAQLTPLQKGWVIGQRDAGVKPSDIAKNLQKTFGIRREKRQINRVLKRAKENPEWLGKGPRVLVDLELN